MGNPMTLSEPLRNEQQGVVGRGPCSAALAGAIKWFARHERLLFGLLILIHLVPVWAFTYLPTTDGAAHLASADVMRKIGDPAHSVFRQYYFVSNKPIPNLIGHLALAGLMSFFSPLVAEKVLVSLYIVLFPLAVRYALRSIRPRAAPLAFLAFPMVYSYLFAQGFYNFCLSIAVFFFVVGYWIRHRDRLNVWRGAALMGLGLLLYSCHLFSLMMACGVMGILAVWFGAREYKKNVRLVLRRAVVTLLAMLPALVLAVLFRPSAAKFQGNAADEWSPKDDLVGLLQFSSLVSYRTGEAWLGGGVASLFGALVLLVLFGKIKRREWSKWDGLLLLPLGLLAVYFKAHDDVSLHFYIPHRVMLYLFLTLLLWLAGQPMARKVRWIAAPLAMVLSLGFVASHAMKYRQFAPQLREFVSAGDQIRRNSTFLPLIFSPRGCDSAGKAISIDVSPFYMASGYIAVAREAVDLRNYEADTDHFPVRFWPKVNPYTHLVVGKGWLVIPPEIDLEQFRRAGGEADYILVWGVTEGMRKNPGTVAIYEQIYSGYERVELKGARWTELWKRRGQ
jgi:hypothetical protein